MFFAVVKGLRGLAGHIRSYLRMCMSSYILLCKIRLFRSSHTISMILVTYETRLTEDGILAEPNRPILKAGLYSPH